MSALEDAADIDFSAFKDPKLARGLIETIHRLAPEHATLMEVCGTHTVAIARNGIRDLMPEGLRLASGPGCPVCVTCNRDIDTVIALARVPEVTIATFGDMTRVPGSTSSLLKEQAAGRSVQIVYSPLDALTLAEQHPERQIVFVGVGFETTTPLVAMAIKRAKAMGLSNFTVFAAHKNMPGALELLVGDPTLELDALILPGHVSTIIGAEPYRFLAEKYGIPGVITGFEPVDVLQGIAMLVRQLHEGRAEIEIAYARGVMPEGNPVALAAIDEVFETCTATWRGLGENCYRYLEKGRKVAVTGTVSARAYTGNDGGVRASLEVTAEAVEFLSSPRHNSDGEGFTEVDDAELPEGFR